MRKRVTFEKEFETTIRVKDYERYTVKSKSKLMEFIKDLTLNKETDEEIAVILPINGGKNGYRIITSHQRNGLKFIDYGRRSNESLYGKEAMRLSFER